MPIEIFSPGKKVDRFGQEYNFTSEDLIKCAQNYDPINLHRAPLLKFHDEAQPAQGLVKSLSFQNNKLLATVEKIDPQFAEEVMSGKFPSVSPKFYPPDHPNNPTPGSWYLRHLAFVSVPACKGNKPPEFQDNDGCPEFASFELVSILRNLRDYFIEAESLEVADKLIPPEILANMERESIAEQIKNMEEAMTEPEPLDSEFAELQEKLAKREAQIALREKKIKQFEYAQFADAHLAQITPALRDRVIEIMTDIGNNAEFAEEGGLLDKFKNFIKNLPPKYSLKPGTPDNLLAESEFSEENIAETVSRLRKIQEEENCGILEAVQKLQKARGAKK